MSEFDQFDPNRPKTPAIPRFYVEPVYLEFKSKQDGKPCYEEREFVQILIPGDRRSSPVEPVNDEHKARWPKEYEAFKQGREPPLEGTPLTEWPCALLNTARVVELAYHNIKTLEQLAAVNDANLQNLGMGAYELRERARKSLDVAKNGTAPLERLISRNEELVRENERLTRELTEANARAASLEQKERVNAGA